MNACSRQTDIVYDADFSVVHPSADRRQIQTSIFMLFQILPDQVEDFFPECWKKLKFYQAVFFFLYIGGGL